MFVSYWLKQGCAKFMAARKHVSSPMRYRDEKVSFGGAGSRDYERFIVLEERVRALREAASETVMD